MLSARIHAVNSSSTQAEMPMLTSSTSALASPATSSHRETIRMRRAMVTVVSVNRYGTPIEPRNFNRSFDRRVSEASVSKITVHSARRTCRSLLAALEVHPRVAMQILRHSKIALTMEIYTGVPSAATRDAIKRLGQWLVT